jgi:predicted nucleotidyltransferase
MSAKHINKDFFISTNHQKVMSFLAKYSDAEFHEREIARKVGISFGSANKVLNELHSAEVLTRHQKGKMLFYSFNAEDPILGAFKILISIAMLRPLVARLKAFASRVILYGSCAKGEDTSRSDVDLFVIAEEPEKAARIIGKFRFSQDFEEIALKPVILSPLELLRSEKFDREFLSLINEGIVLWEEMSNETGIPGVPK